MNLYLFKTKMVRLCVPCVFVVVVRICFNIFLLGTENYSSHSVALAMLDFIYSFFLRLPWAQVVEPVVRLVPVAVVAVEVFGGRRRPEFDSTAQLKKMEQFVFAEFFSDYSMKYFLVCRCFLQFEIV